MLSIRTVIFTVPNIKGVQKNVFYIFRKKEKMFLKTIVDKTCCIVQARFFMGSFCNNYLLLHTMDFLTMCQISMYTTIQRLLGRGAYDMTVFGIC